MERSADGSWGFCFCGWPEGVVFRGVLQNSGREASKRERACGVGTAYDLLLGSPPYYEFGISKAERDYGGDCWIVYGLDWEEDGFDFGFARVARRGAGGCGCDWHFCFGRCEAGVVAGMCGMNMKRNERTEL